jgi:nucleotide-binding universal stress UspA family protein
VPLDFSRSSENALKYAIKLRRENKIKLVLVHVITDPALNVPIYFREKYYRELQKEAEGRIGRLIKRGKLARRDQRLVLLRGQNPARLIVNHAKKARAAMIIMGSHGRTGLRRLVLGSVAERTVRYAECPVLIVK